MISSVLVADLFCMVASRNCIGSIGSANRFSFLRGSRGVPAIEEGRNLLGGDGRTRGGRGRAAGVLVETGVTPSARTASGARTYLIICGKVRV
jgi:hypothetical protein